MLLNLILMILAAHLAKFVAPEESHALGERTLMLYKIAPQNIGRPARLARKNKKGKIDITKPRAIQPILASPRPPQTIAGATHTDTEAHKRRWLDRFARNQIITKPTELRGIDFFLSSWRARTTPPRRPAGRPQSSPARRAARPQHVGAESQGQRAWPTFSCAGQLVARVRQQQQQCALLKGQRL